jgi:hypothetical protein
MVLFNSKSTQCTVGPYNFKHICVPLLKISVNFVVLFVMAIKLCFLVAQTI